MALTYPLSAGLFASRLRSNSFFFSVKTYQTFSGSGEDEWITSEKATPKWEAVCELAPMYNDIADSILSTIEILITRGSNGTFYMHNLRRAGPRNNPDGSLLTAYNPSILAVANGMISLTGMRPNFTLLSGDYLSVDFGTNPVRTAMMKVVESAQANGSGVTPFFTVAPYVKAGVVAGLPVRLVQARCKMMIVPGSFNPGKPGILETNGVSFRAVETF